MSGGGFCTHCGHRIDSFEGLMCCPACGDHGVPCADENQVTVSVNWHELRLLGIWAENYQRTLTPKATVVYAIAKRLEDQVLPTRPELAPLTLATELGDLAKQYEISVSDADLRRDIAEQTGEETGLINPKPPEAA